jgi:hypothetical protein
MKYLALRGANGWPLLIHDIIPTGIATALISAPFLIVRTTDYFHKDGFLDKFGTFSSVLTGFYVAGLVAVATFSMQSSALDEKIDNGPVFLWDKVEDETVSTSAKKQYKIDKRKLTRREYLCQMFGYLATLSMLLTLLTIIAVIVSQGTVLPQIIDISKTRYIPLDLPRGIMIVGFSLPIAHLVATTARGLFYLVDRLYDKKPKILPKP